MAYFGKITSFYAIILKLWNPILNILGLPAFLVGLPAFLVGVSHQMAGRAFRSKLFYFALWRIKKVFRFNP